MLAAIRDDKQNVLNIQHITPNSKRWDYSDIKRLKDPPTRLKVATTLEKPPTPTHRNIVKKVSQTDGWTEPFLKLLGRS